MPDASISFELIDVHPCVSIQCNMDNEEENFDETETHAYRILIARPRFIFTLKKKAFLPENTTA